MKDPKFLFVDDDSDSREIIAGALRDMGFEVDEAENAEAVLILLDQAEYDVLITDVEMTGMSGLELVRRARAQPDHPYVVVMSGTARVKEVLATGVEDFVPKPISLGKFLDMF
ncbi:MAG: response regulator [Candidatus Magasanikbacteria bacterium]|nr:response regulator [Candidatus Magasanikbacteria bacterium]